MDCIYGLGGLCLYARLLRMVEKEGSVAAGLERGSPGLAPAAAAFAGLVVNCLNYVIAWPWQALTFGMLLAWPLSLRVGRPAYNAMPVSNRTAMLCLAPAVLAVVSSPWSIAADRLVQGRSFGLSPRTIYSQDFPVFELQPDGRLELPAGGPARWLEIRTAPDVPSKRKVLLTLSFNGELLVDREPCAAPRRFALEDGVNIVEWSTTGLANLRQRTRKISNIWWIGLLDEKGAALSPDKIRLGGRWP